MNAHAPADPVVLLPGMNCSPRLWQPVLHSPAFAAPPGTGRRPEVLQPSLRGRSLDDCVDRLLAQLPPTFSLAVVDRMTVPTPDSSATTWSSLAEGTEIAISA